MRIAPSDLIALGESWAYHMGHFLSDQKYAARISIMDNQGFTYRNGDIVSNATGLVVANTGLNAHVNLLEDFSTDRLNDPDHWIPQGLYYDLIDDRNDRNAVPLRVNLDDVVFGFYTNQRFFSALDPDVRSVDAFRTRLLSENGNNQAAGVNQIFTFYATW